MNEPPHCKHAEPRIFCNGRCAECMEDEIERLRNYVAANMTNVELEQDRLRLVAEIERLTRELKDTEEQLFRAVKVDIPKLIDRHNALVDELADHTPELITFSLAINLETYLNQGDAPMDRKGRQLAEEALAKYKSLREQR